jgi:hypothetical protein
MEQPDRLYMVDFSGRILLPEIIGELEAASRSDFLYSTIKMNNSLANKKRKSMKPDYLPVKMRYI